MLLQKTKFLETKTWLTKQYAADSVFTKFPVTPVFQCMTFTGKM